MRCIPNVKNSFKNKFFFFSFKTSGTNGASITCDDTMCDENGSDSSVSDDKKCIYQHELGVCCAKKKICGYYKFKFLQKLRIILTILNIT